jgi:hypothetical protein
MVVVAACLVVAIILSTNDGDEQTETDAAADLYSQYISVSDVSFVKRELAAGQVPPQDHGILFVDPDTGAAEFWNVPNATEIGGPRPWLYYMVDSTHRWLLFDGAYGQEPLDLIGDRQTGITYRLPPGWTIAFGPSPDGALILQTTRRGSGPRQLSEDEPEFVLVRLGEPRASIAFGVPGAQSRASAALLGDGRHVVTSGAIVDLATGEVTRFGPVDPPQPIHKTFATDDGGAVAVEADQQATDMVVRRFGSSGQLRDERRYTQANLWGGFATLPSPDGRWLAWQQSLPLYTVTWEDFWPVVYLANLDTGEVVLRALRASLKAGPYQLHWLGDSSAVVVDASQGYIALSPDGSLERLPTASHLYVDVPARRPGAVVDGWPRLTSLSTAWWDAVPETEYGVLFYGFNQRGNEVALVRSSPFYADYLTFPLKQVGLSLKVQEPPFSDQVRLRVLTNGEGLNVRKLPGVAQERLGTLPDGAFVTVANAPDAPSRQCGLPSGCSALHDIDGEITIDSPWWLYVRADSGLAGWVSADYLVWAD